MVDSAVVLSACALDKEASRPGLGRLFVMVGLMFGRA